MAIKDSRCTRSVGVGSAVASGVSELKPDQQTVVGTGNASMLLDQDFSQTSQAALGMRCDYELAGIGPSLATYRRRLAAPDKLRAALSEPPPSPNRVFAWIAVSRAVPTLHRMNGEAVADPDSMTLQRPCQW